MDITIGIQHGRDLQFGTEESADEVEKRLSQALTDGSMFAVTDSKGRRILVPGNRITFVEMGTHKGSSVGFRS